MTYPQRYNKFRQSRIAFWQPKLTDALQGIADNILQQPTIEAAIQQAHGIQPLAELASVIKSMYIDAGRIMGAYAYQEVRRQVKRKVKTAIANNDKKAAYLLAEWADMEQEALQKQTAISQIKAFLFEDVQPKAVINIPIESKESKALLPMGYNEQLVNDIIQYYQTNLLTEAVIPTTEKLRDIILLKLIEAQRQGLSITDVVNAIESGNLTRTRAFLIARTETVKAANYGAKKGAQATGYEMNKVWVSAQQNRTRRIPRDKADHLHMNGIEAAMDEPFNVPDETGIIKMDRPGDSGAPARQVVNCRCCLSFRVL
jgi:hypothetical protein